jgi:hypothetical protein
MRCSASLFQHLLAEPLTDRKQKTLKETVQCLLAAKRAKNVDERIKSLSHEKKPIQYDCPKEFKRC